MGTASRQLKVMLRKNWLLKKRHPFITAAEILLPAIVLLLLAAVRTRVDTQIHPAQSLVFLFITCYLFGFCVCFSVLICSQCYGVWRTNERRK
jgi:hypothetical protein